MSNSSPTDFQRQMNMVPGMGADWSFTKAKEAPNKAQDETAKAKTYDEGKLPLAWLPWAAIDELSKVQQYGHGKYKDYNNYRRGMEVTRNVSCALRHIRDYLAGCDTDHESGCHPLSHAMCRLAFVLQNIHDGTHIDDRYLSNKPFNPDLEAIIKESLRNKP